MGHYAAEMACPRCHEPRCKCPPPVKVVDARWVVDTDFTAIQAADYDKKHGTMNFKWGARVDTGLGHLSRMKLEHFDTRAQAEVHARVLLVRAIAEAKKQVKSLETRLRALP